MTRNEFIPNYYAYSLRINDRDLSASHKEHFIACINKIHRENYKVVYRGDKRSTLQSLYGINGALNDSLSDSLFIIGAKGNMFSGNANSNEIDIARAGENEFSLIFRMLGTLLSRGYQSIVVRKAMSSFKDREQPLASYFLDRKNLTRFLKITDNLDQEHRIILRDYYLALLHHISKSEYYPSSFLMSTTTSFHTAYKFAWKDEVHTSSNPIVLFGWVPKNYEGILSVPDSRAIRRKVNMEAIGLPVYERTFFYGQQEITLKGGLLPHYLIGYLHFSAGNEIFEINPALLETDENWNGTELAIDQRTFRERIANTAFSRYFTVDGDGSFRQDNGN